MRRADAGSPEPLGVTPERGGANVAVYSAHATAMEVCLFDPAGESERERIALPQRTGDVFRDFAMDEHGARNNEPYMPHLFRIDLSRLLRESGFERVEILPFDERGAGLIEDGAWPARSEWHFPWSVIRATRMEG